MATVVRRGVVCYTVLILCSVAMGIQPKGSSFLSSSSSASPPPLVSRDKGFPKIRFANYVAKLPPKPVSTSPPVAASSQSVAEPDYAWDPAVGPPKPHYFTMAPPTFRRIDEEGNCYTEDTDTPTTPLYGIPNPDYRPLEKVANNTVITITCQPPYQVEGNASIQCINGGWIGTFGTCVCPRSPGWCSLTNSQNVYHHVDCDNDGRLDHVCEDYEVTGLTRTIITSSSQCQGNSQVTVKDCPAAFGIFPYTEIGQCFGLRYDPANTFDGCSKSCAAQSDCRAWQWSNVVNQCWLGTPDHCGGSDKQWIGGTRVCNRPGGWCNHSYVGDQYFTVDCDGDGINDHACVNGNTGGRIASGSECKDNWPNAVNDDCHAAFDF